MSLFFWAVWGLAGAFAYAVPLFLTAMFDPPGGVRRPAKAIAEFVVGLSFGVIAGMSAGPYLADQLHRISVTDCRALAVIVGLLVNPVAPPAVRLMTDFALARMGHPLARRKTS